MDERPLAQPLRDKRPALADIPSLERKRLLRRQERGMNALLIRLLRQQTADRPSRRP